MMLNCKRVSILLTVLLIGVMIHANCMAEESVAEKEPNETVLFFIVSDFEGEDKILSNQDQWLTITESMMTAGQVLTDQNVVSSVAVATTQDLAGRLSDDSDRNRVLESIYLSHGQDMAKAVLCSMLEVTSNGKVMSTKTHDVIQAILDYAAEKGITPWIVLEYGDDLDKLRDLAEFVSDDAEARLCYVTGEKQADLQTLEKAWENEGRELYVTQPEGLTNLLLGWSKESHINPKEVNPDVIDEEKNEVTIDTEAEDSTDEIIYDVFRFSDMPDEYIAFSDEGKLIYNEDKTADMALSAVYAIDGKKTVYEIGSEASAQSGISVVFYQENGQLNERFESYCSLLQLEGELQTENGFALTIPVDEEADIVAKLYRDGEEFEEVTLYADGRLVEDASIEENKLIWRYMPERKGCYQLNLIVAMNQRMQESEISKNEIVVDNHRPQLTTSNEGSVELGEYIIFPGYTFDMVDLSEWFEDIDGDDISFQIICGEEKTSCKEIQFIIQEDDIADDIQKDIDVYNVYVRPNAEYTFTVVASDGNVESNLVTFSMKTLAVYDGLKLVIYPADSVMKGEKLEATLTYNSSENTVNKDAAEAFIRSELFFLGDNRAEIGLDRPIEFSALTDFAHEVVNVPLYTNEETEAVLGFEYSMQNQKLTRSKNLDANFMIEKKLGNLTRNTELTIRINDIFETEEYDRIKLEFLDENFRYTYREGNLIRLTQSDKDGGETSEVENVDPRDILVLDVRHMRGFRLEGTLRITATDQEGSSTLVEIPFRIINNTIAVILIGILVVAALILLFIAFMFVRKQVRGRIRGIQYRVILEANGDCQEGEARKSRKWKGYPISLRQVMLLACVLPPLELSTDLLSGITVRALKNGEIAVQGIKKIERTYGYKTEVTNSKIMLSAPDGHIALTVSVLREGSR